MSARGRSRSHARNRRRSHGPSSYACPLLQALGAYLAPLENQPTTRRRWQPLPLVSCAVLMVYLAANSLQEAFARARAALRCQLGARGAATYQGLLKALLASSGLWTPLYEHLRQCTQAQARDHWQIAGFAAFGVDGTKVNLPRSRANCRAFGIAGRHGSGPQAYLTALFHLGSGLPWAWKIGPVGASERHHLRQMLKVLPPGALIVADAGFVGYAVLAQVLRSGRHVLIRAGANTHLIRDLGLRVGRGRARDRVYLWPGRCRRRTYLRRPLVLRQIRLGRGRRQMVLLTDILEHGRLGNGAAWKLYRLRWGLEVRYRDLKGTLGKRNLFSRTPEHVALELDLAMLGLWLLGLLATRRGDRRRAWSVRQALTAARVAAERPGRQGLGHLHAAMARARLDGYLRKRPKAARYWPHKKTSRPCGVPEIRAATAAELQWAQRVEAPLMGS